MHQNAENVGSVLRAAGATGAVRELPDPAPTVVWAAGGHVQTVFPTTFAELVRLTGGTPADVG